MERDSIQSIDTHIWAVKTTEWQLPHSLPTEKIGFLIYQYSSDFCLEKQKSESVLT